MRAAAVADRDAEQEVLCQLAVDTTGEAAEIVGEGARVGVAADGAEAAHRAAPGAPQGGRHTIAGDVAGLGQRHAVAAAGRSHRLGLAKLLMKSCAPRHAGRGEAGIVLAAQRVERGRAGGGRTGW